MRLNLRHKYSARPGHRHVDVYCKGKRVCSIVRGNVRECWVVLGFGGRLHNHGRFTRRGDALRAIKTKIEKVAL